MSIDRTCVLSLAFSLLAACSSPKSSTPRVAATPEGRPSGTEDVEHQPFAAQAARIVEALDLLGSPLSGADRRTVEEGIAATDPALGVAAIQRALDRYVLLALRINFESRVTVLRGAASPALVQGDLSTFLVKVINDAGVTAPLRISSPDAVDDGEPAAAPDGRWLEIRPYVSQPLRRELSGLRVEYRVISLGSRDPGPHEARLGFDVGQGRQNAGFESQIDVLFQCARAFDIELRIEDENAAPATAALTFRDEAGRVHPSQARRDLQDFYFQPQVYRREGERVRLSAGRYRVTCSRGPEYLSSERTLIVSGPREARFQLQRWIDPSKLGWWSGDHHIHAAGCAHYQTPGGVPPEFMIRQCQGEDVKVGCNLTWGAAFQEQMGYFTGAIDKVSRYPYLLRYDIEVSGFGSHKSGHLCLLRLKEQIYPGGPLNGHWPTLGLSILRWAKAQGAICGPGHSGLGLAVQSDELPNDIVPPFDGIGANEYIVDVTHEVDGPNGALVPAIDILSVCDTPAAHELNIWYHTLNAGYRPRIAGETDFPCLSDDRLGTGRSYVKVEGRLDFDRWCDGLRDGRSYVSDGRSHLMEMRVDGTALGENGSELHLAAPSTVHVRAVCAARLDEAPHPEIQDLQLQARPYWHVERARVPGTREVPVEVIVNGRAVASARLLADGAPRDIAFDVPIQRSSWVALRIFPSSHTNPVFVLVGGKPVRASRQSARWCLAGVDQCWREKQAFIRPAERIDALAAYEHARAAYRQRILECEVE